MIENLGSLYFTSKSLVIIAAIVFILLQMYSNYYFSITTSDNGEVVVKHRSGIFYSADNPGQSDESEIKNDVICYLTQNVGDCKTLSFLTLFQTITLVLLILSFIPVFGEPVGILGAVMLLIFTIYVFVFMSSNKDSAEKFAKSAANIPESQQCNAQQVCVKTGSGESFVFNILLVLLSMAIISQSSYGLYAVFGCN